MKLSIAWIVIVIIGVIGGILYFVPSTQTVLNERVVEVEKVVEVPTLDKRIEDAQNEARSDIEAKAQEAYNAFVEKEMTRIADEVKAEYIAEIEATISADASY